MVEKTSGWGKVATILICAVLFIIALCCLIPLWHVLISSISDGQKLLAHEGVVFYPLCKPTLDGYRYVFRDSRIPTEETALESLPYRLGERVDRWRIRRGAEAAGERRYAQLSYRIWRTVRATTRRITGNLSFALLMLCVAVCLLLIYVFTYHL